MKKFLVLAALALFSVGFAVTHADAAPVKKIIELGWLTPDVNEPGGGYLVSLATRPLASEALDTTGVFSLMDASELGGGSARGDIANVDSVLIGYLVCYTDSTADGASTLTAATATIDASGDGRDWAAVCTVALVAASDDPVVTGALVQRTTIDHLNLLTTAPRLRIRFTAATGYLLACRVKVIYWVDESCH